MERSRADDRQKIRGRLGWLDTDSTIDRDRLRQLQDETRDCGFDHIVLLGMGGSSLAPEVLAETFGAQPGFPTLITLDSTDPARIRQVEAAIDIERTLFVVASKSGGTIETLALDHYFWERTGGNPEQFIVITDAGSKLEQTARQARVRDIFINPSDIGGRYSALSYFGLVPAALIGLDLDRLWESADTMLASNRESIPSVYHPGLLLGAVIGALASEGRDKVTIYTTRSLASFGDWAEQLLAESLGKQGRGALPVVGAAIGKPNDYVSDRLFVYLRVDNDPDVAEKDAAVRALREAGHPRVTLRVPDAFGIAGEFFRWEYAAAIAGVLLDVNPFDEPNVAEAKAATKDLLRHFRDTGSLPSTEPIMRRDSLELTAAESTLEPLRELCRQHGYDGGDVAQVIAAQMAATHAGDYFAFLIYFTPSEAEALLIDQARRRLRHVTKRAVTVGYGPRYLHSTGQYHKGGGDNGVLWLLTADAAPDLAIPGLDFSFGTLFAAQAAGDLNALQSHGRRVIKLHLPGDRANGLGVLLQAIDFVESRRG